MKLGIIGLPQTGKTTLFNALTGHDQPTTASAGRIEVHTAVVDVPDPRVDTLSAMYNPKKTAYAKVTYADIAGLEGSGQGSISGQLLNQIAQMDGLIHVVRCFEDDSVPHAAGSVNPLRDIDSMNSELLLNDLIVVERKLEKLTEERKRGGTDKVINARQTELFERILAILSEDKPLRGVEFSDQELNDMSGFGLLTRKPMMILLNLGEGQAKPEVEAELSIPVVDLMGKLEMEISQLPEDDAEMFMAEYEIKEPGLNKMIRLSYDLLTLQSFFTVGEDEVRAWTVKRGANAQEAAGTIHSDLEKGFIRAEVVTYEDLTTLGSMSEARNHGKFRLEGKKYIVQDGEIVHIRFNI
ncbi:MAG: redox-regulated ATPase YchF [Anaerolineae bacterium]|jgi:ribosome-binding ATPase|nr:redox-regulated ATPase YchF [Anaerolineae bacterium]MBT7192042.1 redox-regulated ATPase YchF [Anaerolineae bacterium]MBT7988860.1 redox-regulated ATPase YchF [Anaerolineae bacterium]